MDKEEIFDVEKIERWEEEEVILNKRWMLYAEKAKEEGYPYIAKLFMDIYNAI